MDRRLALVAGAVVIALAAFAVALQRDMTEKAAENAVANAGVAASTPRAASEQLIAFYSGRIEQDPWDFVSYTRLGEAWMQRARETGDTASLDEAHGALGQARALRPDDVDATAALASVRLAQHEFQDAIDLARAALATDPGATSALATIGDAQIALGDLAAGRATYRELAARERGPEIDVRLAHIAELDGDLAGAVELVRGAERAAVHAGRTGERLAWYRTLLGALLLKSDQAAEAETAYRTALAEFPGYVFAIAGLAGVKAAQGDTAAAAALYEQALTRCCSATPDPLEGQQRDGREAR
jgi:tetratricopeptide (TPR) repeat protein